MLEKDVEKYLVRACKHLHWPCFKFSSPSQRAVPDRIVIAPGRNLVFVECKAPGKRPTRQQKAMHRKLFTHGYTTIVVDSKDSVNELIYHLRPLTANNEDAPAYWGAIEDGLL